MQGDLPRHNSPEISMVLYRFFNRLTTPLYAVIDTARDRRIFSLLEDADCDVQPLYPPGFSLAMDHRGPHLVALRPNSSFLDRLTTAGWGNSWGIYLAGPDNFAAVRRHLRRMLFVQLQGGERALFRFYDPRVLRDLLPNCTKEELLQFFGPLTAAYLESHTGREVVCFSLDRAGGTDEQPPTECLSEYRVKLT
ncbi:hypothetical protein GMLC_36060 [Geomonas limicola]|uniref:DUF4123 domain-containing protein n=1 Tax=Geomonas limicola TaxID=2740186 RepID=A0A6V8NE19_9BACT|nr:hypothetical protein GMLC_36060 [Geomonas limicola]